MIVFANIPNFFKWFVEKVCKKFSLIENFNKIHKKKQKLYKTKKEIM